MSDKKLRAGLIRLAYEKPELRKDILPLISKEAITKRDIETKVQRVLSRGKKDMARLIQKALYPLEEPLFDAIMGDSPEGLNLISLDFDASDLVKGSGHVMLKMEFWSDVEAFDIHKALRALGLGEADVKGSSKDSEGTVWRVVLPVPAAW